MGRHNKIHWDLDALKQMYEQDRLTVQQIGERLGCSGKAVNKACKRLGVQMRRRGPKNGEEHPGWKGGLTTDKAGYRLRHRPDHPQCNSNGYVREHRLVAESLLGRTLFQGEVVHHIDDDPANNSPENLQVFPSNADHLRETLKGKTPQWTLAGREAILSATRRSRSSSRRGSATGGPA
jgi:hypothetical protein